MLLSFAARRFWRLYSRRASFVAVVGGEVSVDGVSIVGSAVTPPVAAAKWALTSSWAAEMEDCVDWRVSSTALVRGVGGNEVVSSMLDGSSG